MQAWCDAHFGSESGFDVVGHRVVHGGSEYARPVLIEAAVLAALERLVPLAPLHQPHQIAAIRAISAAAPAVPQVATSFDTAFHRSQPPLAQQYASAASPYRTGYPPLWFPRSVLRVHCLSAA